MNKIFIGLATLLIASPVAAHPRNPRTTWTYSYPEKDVMVRRDWKRCKKIRYVTKYDKYDSEKKKFAKADRKMKFGKFYDKAKEAKSRLRPGEVKRYDKKLGRYVSNKD